MITVQGDTEFASVEQQRHLLATAPTDYDRYAAARIMAEEQRHGWQMAYLLMTYFGQQGAREAQKLLERNAQDGNRLLGAFNRPMPHWLDFFCYRISMFNVLFFTTGNTSHSSIQFNITPVQIRGFPLRIQHLYVTIVSILIMRKPVLLFLSADAQQHQHAQLWFGDSQQQSGECILLHRHLRARV